MEWRSRRRSPEGLPWFAQPFFRHDQIVERGQPCRSGISRTSTPISTRPGAFLAAREAEHNLIFGIARPSARPPSSTPAPYLAVVERDRTGGRSSAPDAALPPGPLRARRPVGARRPGRDNLERDHARRRPARPRRRRLRRARGTPAAVRPVAARHVRADLPADAVVPPRRVAGPMARRTRPATATSALAWTRRSCARRSTRTIRRGGRRGRPLARAQGPHLYLWEDGGRCRCTGVGGATPNGIRIGPVYTPPDCGTGLRQRTGRRGEPARAGCRPPLLLPVHGPANPTANHIYRAIGYEPVRDVDAYRFDAG